MYSTAHGIQPTRLKADVDVPTPNCRIALRESGPRVAAKIRFAILAPTHSDIVRSDGHLANLLAVEPVGAADGRDSVRDPVQRQPVGDELGKGVFARLDQRPAGHEVGSVGAPH